MKNEKSQVAVIDFAKFDIQQLPELHGKKEEIKKVIEANPVVKITDNTSYELAKKSRTAVKTLRTSLEKEKKDVNDRIKNNVLLVVANEYDSLIADVRNDENARQEEVTAWEEIKENERLEKLRLEQERVGNIKKSIYEFRIDGERFIDTCVFESIDATKAVFEKRVAEFDRLALGEFEVLFDDAVLYLTNLLNSKINILEVQETIRLDKIKLEKEQERQRLEADRIAKEQATEREKIEAEQKRVAEEQRIAQENFLREKKEFEEKQVEAKFQERKKHLIELGMIDDEKERLIFGDGEFRYSQIREFDEATYQESVRFFTEKIAESLIVEHLSEVKSNESAKEERVFESIPSSSTSEVFIGHSIQAEYQEADLDPKGAISNDLFKKEQSPVDVYDVIEKIDANLNFDGRWETQEVEFEETWESIESDFESTYGFPLVDDFVTTADAFKWLSDNFNVPSRKN